MAPSSDLSSTSDISDTSDIAGTAAPTSDLDLFTDAVLDDPYPAFTTLRNLGPAVYLPAHDAWAMARYADVRAALGDPETFSSVDGIALTDEANQQILAGTVLAADGADHARLRRPLSKQLAPRAIRDLTDVIRQRADRLVAGLVARGRFDAVEELAQQFVADVVMELMGLPGDTRDEVIHNAAATFDCFGPNNARYQQAAPAAGAMIAFLQEKVTRETVTPDSWMGAVYQAADRGQIDESDVVPLMSAYTAAGMDTTIHAVSNALYLLATHPDQWEHLRSGDATSTNAFHETIRHEAPVQAFGRRVTRDTTVDGVALAAGQQVWLLYGSTGRDERRWGPTADTFDIRRPDAAEHLALGHGPHSCAGNHLSALEVSALLDAFLTHCDGLEPDGEPVRAPNNVLRGWGHLPIRVRSARH